ncbi:unnamed protein product [Candida verbasci]|uniref:K Homology domain-containing protein n=1 Tax=Candida verbasci TaxID=1227364 RepID=A0A9W4X9B0_9ASCO|nr:unnamed protein product [Candida verbasci]
MPTPAEIIAARYQQNNNQNQAIEEEIDYSTNGNGNNLPNKTSISDENAFPTLGGGSKPSPVQSSSTWGPKMKAPPAQVKEGSPTSMPALKSKNGSNGSNSYKSKVSTIQEAFSLDFEDQLNVAKPEFSKILTSIQSETKTKIEFSSSQHTKKRIFLISGRPEEVKLAKKLVIKKLTKSVKLQFTIPSKLRSKVIGQGGKTLKPIIQANEVKIEISDQVEDIENDEDEEEDVDEDIFSKVVKVTIDGDIEGSKAAKNQILQIIKEESKNLSTKIKIDEKVKPFVEKSLESVIASHPDLTFSIPDYKSNKNNLIVIGDRELILQVKPEIKKILNNLESKITVEEVPIPETKQQFLPIDEVLETFNVLIQLPKDTESNVKFIGESKNIKKAQDAAKKTTLQYKVEVLDMSKAHKGNLNHVKAVAALLNKLGIFKQISEANEVVINPPTEFTNVTSIPIEIVAKAGDEDKIKLAKKAIVSNVNKITPDQTKTVEDIDEFLINKVDETIKEIAKQENVEYVIIDDVITLFGSSTESQDDAEDFEEVESTTEKEASFDKINTELDKLRKLSENIINSVLEVSKKQQNSIVSKSLKSIISSVEPNSVVVKLNYPSDDELTIHGLKSAVAIIKKNIESDLSDFEEHPNGFTAQIQVPSQVVPRLIGKNGANLNQLRDEFNVKIDVPEDKDNKKEEKVEVTIVGLKRNVEDAKAKILSLSKKWADEILSRVRIENQYHRRIIGPKGVYINRLQDKYNVKIRFPSVNGESNGFLDAPKSPNEITIKGPSKGVAKAEEELKELYQFEKENGFKQTVQIPIKAIARVIGKSGETINDIADGTGVEYKFNRDNESEEANGYSEVELTGSKTALKEATTKINAIINEVENFVSRSIQVDPKYHRDLIGPGGSIMKSIISKAGGDDIPRNKYQRLLNIPNQGSGSNEITSQGDKSVVDKIIESIESIIKEKESMIINEIEIPKDKHRLIIGPNGSIRHALQDEFNVTIDIPRANDDSSIVKIKGLPEQIDAVITKIQEFTKDDWKKVVEVPSNYHGLISERGGIFKRFKNEYNVEITHGNFTRQANKLSNNLIPNPPKEAYPEENETIKFTIIENTSDEDGELIPWRLKGEDSDVDKVFSLIEEKLNLAKNSNYQGWFYLSQPSNFSKIIGPQGSRINQLRNKTNTFITVPRSNDKINNNENFIYLIGNEENLNKAEKEIKNLL